MKLLLSDNKTEVVVQRVADSLSDGSYQLTVTMEGKSVEEVEQLFSGKTETLTVEKEDGSEVIFEGYSKIYGVNRDISANEDVVRVTLKR